jgi:ParB family transcriptional regulator, chromosome partitioning protein
MTTGSAAKAGHSGEKEKEKTGIRRALGRGLESLLPGPRVVAARPAVAPAASPSAEHTGADAGTRAGAPAPHDQPHVQSSGAAGETQIPHFVRNDNAAGVEAAAETMVGTIQAVVEDVVGASAAGFSKSPLLAKDAKTGAPMSETGTVAAEHEPITIQASAEVRTASNLVVQLPLDHIDSNPYQTRYMFDEEMLRELAESIKTQGVVQPVVVRPGENGRYVLILGERRCRASKLAGKTSIPAIVRRVSDQQAAEMTIIENLQREDLNCMEQAEAFRVLSQEFKLTQEQIGARVGLSRESVSNYMRLLRLPQPVMEYLATNQLTFSEARELMTLNDEKLITKAADIAVKKHLSIEKIEDLVMEMQGLGPIRPEKKGGGARWVDPNVKAAQTELERLLQVRVRIRDRRGHGKIVIEYSTVDDYERVVEALRGKK